MGTGEETQKNKSICLSLGTEGTGPPALPAGEAAGFVTEQSGWARSDVISALECDCALADLPPSHPH